MDIIQLISNVGFPIAACMFMAWYVKDTSAKQWQEISDMTERHNDDIDKMTAAINNNTLAVQILCEKLSKGKEGE